MTSIVAILVFNGIKNLINIKAAFILSIKAINQMFV